MPNFELRQAEESELTTALLLFKQAAESIAKKGIDHWQYWHNPPKEKIEWLKEGFSKKEFYFIISDNDDLIGMVRVLASDELYWGQMPDKAKYVHSLVITEKYSGQNLGQQVLDFIGKKARTEGIPLLRLDCDAGNPKLCAFYEKLGFEKVGQKKFELYQNNLYERAN